MMTSLTREIDARVREIDHELAVIERELDLLLNITPVNAAEAWRDFEKSGFTVEPSLRSRPLGFVPDLVLRHLYSLEIEQTDDPALAELFEDKRDEIARQITLLKDRDTSRFMHGSLQLYGEVGNALVADAEMLLSQIPHGPIVDRAVTASGFAEAAQEELDAYRSIYPGSRTTSRSGRTWLQASPITSIDPFGPALVRTSVLAST